MNPLFKQILNYVIAFFKYEKDALLKSFFFRTTLFLLITKMNGN